MFVMKFFESKQHKVGVESNFIFKMSYITKMFSKISTPL